MTCFQPPSFPGRPSKQPDAAELSPSGSEPQSRHGPCRTPGGLAVDVKLWKAWPEESRRPGRLLVESRAIDLPDVAVLRHGAVAVDSISNIVFFVSCSIDCLDCCCSQHVFMALVRCSEEKQKPIGTNVTVPSAFLLDLDGISRAIYQALPGRRLFLTSEDIIHRPVKVAARFTIRSRGSAIAFSHVPIIHSSRGLFPMSHTTPRLQMPHTRPLCMHGDLQTSASSRLGWVQEM